MLEPLYQFWVWFRIVIREIWIAYIHFFFSGTPMVTTSYGKYVHTMLILGDDTAYGSGDYVMLGRVPGLANHLVHAFANEGKLRHAWQVYNCGVKDSTSEDWLPVSQIRLESASKRHLTHLKHLDQAEVICLFIGLNDSKNDISPDRTIENIAALCRVLKDMGKDVFLSYIPTRGSKESEHIQQRNQMIRDYIGSNADFVKEGLDLGGYEYKLNKFYWIDGRHFSTDGYRKLANDLCGLLANAMVKREFALMKKDLGWS